MRKPKPIEDKIRIVTAICDLYATGQYTIYSCCEANGIKYVCFTVWCKKHKELNDIYQECINKKYETKYYKLKEIALAGLDMLLRPQTVVETTTEEMPFKVKGKDGNEEIKIERKVITKTKTIMPNPTAVVFALSNLDSDNFRRTDSSELQNKSTGNDVDIEKREAVLDEMLNKAQQDKEAK